MTSNRQKVNFFKKSLLATSIALFIQGCSQSSLLSEPSSPAQVERTAEAVQAESARLHQWFEAQYEASLLRSPLSLTFVGRKERYDEFNDFSEAESDKELALLKASVDELKQQFNYDLLDADSQISYRLWVNSYERRLAMKPYRKNEYVFTQMQGSHSFFPNFLINFHRVDTESDMTAYIKRIGGVSVAIRQLLEQAQKNADYGVRAPYFSYDIVIDESKKLVSGYPFEAKTKTDNALMADARRKIQSLVEKDIIDQTQAEQLTENTKEALLTHFKPAYEALISWLTEDRKNVNNLAQGVGALPNGKAFYKAQLKSHTTTDMTANDIHQLGLREVARLRAEMIAIKEQTGFEGDLPAFFEYLNSAKNDERFFYPDTDAGRQGYLDDSKKYLGFIEEKLPEYFGILPKAPLEVKRVEAFREQPGAAQHYYPGTPDGSRPGIYYAHLSDMTSMPKSEMEAIAYHEGSPGHHMQISIAQELTSVPKFRTKMGFTSYAEGWALYSELLAKEMGAYQNIYSDFGRLSTEIWRAIRLVVDTGLHAKGWSEEQAIQYFMDNAPVTRTQAQSEIRRYMVWPGQATTYKIGMLKILELREYAREALGDRFDIRGFHDTILGGGALPMDILEQQVNRWVTKQTDQS